MTTKFQPTLHQEYKFTEGFFKCIAQGRNSENNEVFVLRKAGCSDKGTMYVRMEEVKPFSKEYNVTSSWEK